MPRKTPDGDPVPSLPPAGAKRSDSRTETHSRNLTPSDRIIVWLAGLPSPQSEMACPLNRSPTPELDVDSSQPSIISGTPHAGGTRVRLHGLDFFHIPSAGPAIELAELYQGDESQLRNLFGLALKEDASFADESFLAIAGPDIARVYDAVIPDRLRTTAPAQPFISLFLDEVKDDLSFVAQDPIILSMDVTGSLLKENNEMDLIKLGIDPRRAKAIIVPLDFTSFQTPPDDSGSRSPDDVHYVLLAAVLDDGRRKFSFFDPKQRTKEKNHFCYALLLRLNYLIVSAVQHYERKGKRSSRTARPDDAARLKAWLSDDPVYSMVAMDRYTCLQTSSTGPVICFIALSLLKAEPYRLTEFEAIRYRGKLAIYLDNNEFEFPVTDRVPAYQISRCEADFDLLTDNMQSDESFYQLVPHPDVNIRRALLKDFQPPAVLILLFTINQLLDITGEPIGADDIQRIQLANMDDPIFPTTAYSGSQQSCNSDVSVQLNCTPIPPPLHFKDSRTTGNSHPTVVARLLTILNMSYPESHVLLDSELIGAPAVSSTQLIDRNSRSFAALLERGRELAAIQSGVNHWIQGRQTALYKESQTFLLTRVAPKAGMKLVENETSSVVSVSSSESSMMGITKANAETPPASTSSTKSKSSGNNFKSPPTRQMIVISPQILTPAAAAGTVVTPATSKDPRKRPQNSGTKRSANKPYPPAVVVNLSALQTLDNEDNPITSPNPQPPAKRKRTAYVFDHNTVPDGDGVRESTKAMFLAAAALVSQQLAKLAPNKKYHRALSCFAAMICPLCPVGDGRPVVLSGILFDHYDPDNQKKYPHPGHADLPKAVTRRLFCAFWTKEIWSAVRKFQRAYAEDKNWPIEWKEDFPEDKERKTIISLPKDPQIFYNESSGRVMFDEIDEDDEENNGVAMDLGKGFVTVVNGKPLTRK